MEKTIQAKLINAQRRSEQETESEEKGQELIKHRRESRDFFITLYKHEAVFTSFDCLIFGLFQAKRVVPHLCSLTYGAHIWWHFPWITQVKAIDAFRLRNLLSETDREKKNSIQMFERVLWVCPSVCCLLRMIVVRLFSFFLSLVLFTPFPCISYWSNNDNDKNSNNNQTQSKSTEANSSNWNTCTQHCFMWSFVCLKTNCLNGCTDGSLAGLFVCLFNKLSSLLHPMTHILATANNEKPLDKIHRKKYYDKQKQ